MTATRERIERLEVPDLYFAGEHDPLAVRRPGVLLALGDLQARVELAGFLVARGFDVWLAGSGVDAITTYLEHAGSVDVLLLDADLADLPGPAFLRRFHTHFPGVPCVFRAGYSGAVSEQLADAGVPVVPRTITPIAIAERLCEEIAFKEWVGD